MKTILLICAVVLYAFPGFSQGSQNVDLLYQWHDTSITVNYRDSRYSDVWGLVHNGREYAVMGSTYGVHVFDVTDPANVYHADSAAGADQGYWMNHRDYKDYKGYLYAVCDEGSSTLQIYDLSYLPDSIHKELPRPGQLVRRHEQLCCHEEGWHMRRLVVHQGNKGSQALLVTASLAEFHCQRVSQEQVIRFVDEHLLNAVDSGVLHAFSSFPSLPGRENPQTFLNCQAHACR